MRRAMEKTFQLLLVAMSVLSFAFCQEIRGQLRLVGGSNNREGRVEIFMDGEWGTICDDEWDLNVANIACRSLGLPTATAAPGRAAFGPGIGRVMIYDIECEGYESGLTGCRYNRYDEQRCSHDEDAGVVCGVPGLKGVELNIDNLTAEISSPGYPHHMEKAYYEWTFTSPIPHADIALYFENIDLHRESGTSCLKVEEPSSNPALYIKNDKHKPVSMIMEYAQTVKVTYYSTSTSNHSLGSRGFRMRYYTYSVPDEDYQCPKNWSIFITQNDPGRIDVSWSPVPPPASSLPVSTYTYLVLYKLVEHHKEDTYPKYNFTSVVGSRTAVIDFLHPNRKYSIKVIALDTSSVNSTTMHSCTQKVKVLDVKLRLVGGNFSNEGRVEVLYHGIWGTICTNWWDKRDANVVCRALGLPAARYTSDYEQIFSGLSRTTSWIAFLKCSGTEESIALCPHDGWGNTPSHCSNSLYTVSVVCGSPQVTNLTITDVSGVITSPGYPYYMQQARYLWTFRPPVPNADIAIYFEDVDFSREYGKSTVVFKNSASNNLLFEGYHGGFTSPQVFISPAKTGKMVYFSSFTTLGKGFLMRYLVLDRYWNEAPTRNISIMVSSTSPHSISVACGSFTADGFQVLGYLITCNSTDDWHSTVSYAIADNRTKNGSCHRLVGLTNYRVQVFAVGTNVSDGRMMTYKSQAMNITTMEGVPGSSPWPVNVMNSTTSTIFLSWLPVSRYYAHGDLRYIVYYEDNEYRHKKNVTTDHLRVLLTNLLPGMRYDISVHGLTSQGQGPPTSTWAITKCGRRIENQLYGTFSNPSYERHAWRINCIWTVKSSSSKGLILLLLHVDIPDDYLCRYFYAAVYESQGYHKLCNVRKTLTFTSTSSVKVQSQSYSGWSTRFHNFVMKARYYVLDNGFHGVPVEKAWNINAQTVNSSAINVQWSEYPLSSNMAPYTRVVSYVAVCIAVKKHTNISIASTNGQGRRVDISYLESDTEYYVQVIAVLSNSSNPTRALPNETFYRRSKNITARTKKDFTLRQASRNVWAAVQKSNNIYINWDPIPSPYIHGMVLGYRVYYKRRYSYDKWVVLAVPANQTSVVLRNLAFLTVYNIRVASVTIAGEGPLSRPETVVETGLDCDVNLSGHYGSFSSPDHPNDYPSDADCRWTIGKDMKPDGIIIFFNYFYLEEDSTCSYDDVKVTDSKGFELGGGKFCGHRRPFAVISQRPAAVNLRSDDSGEYAGFSGIYYVIDNSTKDIDLKVSLSTPTKLMLEIKDAGVRITEFVVLYKEKDSQKTWNVSTSSSTNITIQRLVPFKEYEVRVVAYYNGSVYTSRLVTVATQEQLKTEKPSTTQPPTPRSPSETDIQNSVNITIQGLNITEWNYEKELKLKGAVAEEVTKSCGTQSCFSLTRKQRRANGPNVTFTARDVHLLPGYPVQLSYWSIPDHVTAVVAFYVKFPPVVAIGVTDTVDKDLLVDIVNGSLARIGRAINKTILSVSGYMVQTSTDQPITKPTTSKTTTSKTTSTNAGPLNAKSKQAKPGYVRYLIIGGSVGGALLIIIIIALLTVRYIAQKNKAKKQVAIELKTKLISRESRDEMSNLETSTTV